jgi:predicted nicotinamide N-methyase
MERGPDGASTGASPLIEARRYRIQNSLGEAVEPIIAEYFSSDETVFTWPCALAMSAYLMSNPGTVKEKVVLELGSGTGLPSIVSLMLGAEHVISTERRPEEFPQGYKLLRFNFELNKAPAHKFTVVGEVKCLQPNI